jgi:hypothetical protein
VTSYPVDATGEPTGGLGESPIEIILRHVQAIPCIRQLSPKSAEQFFAKLRLTLELVARDKPGLLAKTAIHAILYPPGEEESALDIVLRYVRAIPYRRRLSREQAKLFTRKTMILLETAARDEPGLLEEMAVHAILHIPKKFSRSRKLLAEVIESVLEDLNIFHSRSGECTLPASWDIADPDTDTLEWRRDREELARDLRKVLGRMKDARAARMLKAYHWDGATMSQVGDEFDLSKQRISEIMPDAVSALIIALYTFRAARQ